MRLLVKAAALLRRCEQRVQRCEASLLRLQAALNELDHELHELHEQGRLLTAMAQRPLSGPIDRAGLFAHLRRHALRRHHLQALNLRGEQLQEQRAAVELQRQQAAAEMQYWRRKGEKFERYAGALRLERRRRGTLREETEIMEKYTWKQVN